MNELDFQKAFDTNILELGSFEMEALDDRIMVIEDEFRSGYECAQCLGKQTVICPECAGLGQYEGIGGKNWKKCSACSGTGKVKCPACDGKGALLVTPEVSERRPTTGRIVSIGQNVRSEKLIRGVSVIFPSHIGHVYEVQAWDQNGNEVMVVVRIMRENEVLAKVKGHLDLRRVRKEAVNVTD